MAPSRDYLQHLVATKRKEMLWLWHWKKIQKRTSKQKGRTLRQKRQNRRKKIEILREYFKPKRKSETKIKDKVKELKMNKKESWKRQKAE